VKREWNEFIIAFYKEYQKHYTESNLRFLARRTMKFDDWVENPLTQKLHETYLNLEHQLLQCKMIDTRSYRYSSHINNQILADIGIVSEKKDIPKENTSFSNVDSEILRLFNQWHYSKNAKEALISLLIPKEFDLSSYSLKSLGERTNSGYLELTYFLRMLQYFIPQKSKEFVVETEVFVSRIEYLANLVEEKTHIKL
jgi:hypothetical protein